MTVKAENLEVADKAVRMIGRVANYNGREVHEKLADRAGVDAEALENYINHNTKALTRYFPMSNDTKSIVATALRHAFVVAAMAARLDEREQDADGR